MKKQIVLYSPLHLEPWNYTTPNTTGIGGSETCHVELAYHFAKSGYDVVSIAPCERKELGPAGAQWLPLSEVDNVLNSSKEKIWLVFRDPTFFDKNLNHNNDKYYFIAQDVDYDWNEQRLERVDKYICLCQTHAKYTLSRYPPLDKRLFVSSNGIDTLKLCNVLNNQTERKSKRLIYSSSPDRGLELILDNWFRVEERHPDVQLDVYYGFDNLKKLSSGNDWRSELYVKLLSTAAQYPKTVTLHGRLSQNQLHKEMSKSSIWFYPTNFPETSCITCMEMQALGVYPIVTKFWAVGENTLNGKIIDGIPQDDILVRCSIFKELNNLLYVDKSEEMDKIRKIISEDALDSFGWDKIAKQYQKWFEE
jgi:glycosyltransferase involved in cell wall biosynthesis